MKENAQFQETLILDPPHAIISLKKIGPVVPLL